MGGHKPDSRRARLGLIVPPTNSVNEREWLRALPNGAILHVARMPLHLDAASDAGRRALEADLTRAASGLAAAGADVLAYGCTAGSLVLPLNRLTDFMTGLSGKPSVATAPAIVAALRRLNAKRVALATPYHDALNADEAAFLAACGFDVVSLAGLGHGMGGVHEFTRIAHVASDEVEALVGECDRPEADVIVLSCTDLATQSIHAALEARFAKPVVSSNQAALWAALEAASIPTSPPLWGQLMRMPPPIPMPAEPFGR